MTDKIEEEELIKRLVDLYCRDDQSAYAVSIVCDNALDKTGKLLGEVRKKARGRGG